MATRRFPTSSRTRKKRASSSSRRTASRAATSSGRPSAADLASAAGRGIRDVIAPGLRILFVGINPGLYTAATGHHFARPGNRFWPALHRAGLTETELHPSQQRRLLANGIGVTNLVNRATAAAEDVSPGEFAAGRHRLAVKIRRYRPGNVVFLGVGAYCYAFGLRRAAIGPQPGLFEGAQVWVLPNPSGLNANYRLADFARLFRSVWTSIGRG